MESMKLQGRGEITITSEALLQIVRNHFDRINPSQWGLLANETWDTGTKDILLSMFVQLVQQLSANVLKMVIPMDEVRRKDMIEEESQRAFQTITAVLQESIGLIFGQALKVPSTQEVDQSKVSEELTMLLEDEVSHKVNSILSTIETKEEPIRVTATLSNERVGREMLNRAKQCLHTCLKALRCTCGPSRPVTGQRNEPMARPSSESSVYERKKSPCHCCFTLFARKNFKKMQENLGNKISSVLVDIGSTSSATSVTQTSLAGSPVTTPSVSSRTASPVLSAVEGSPRLASSPRTPTIDYEAIQKDVDEIFRVMNMVKYPGSSARQKRLNTFLQSNEATTFLDKLTNKMYSHFQLQANSQEQGTTFSQSTQNMELLNLVLQEELGRFIKKLQGFMQQDPSDDKVDLFEMYTENPPVLVSRSSEVSNSSQVSVPSFNDRRWDIFERSMVHPKACVPSFVSADVPAIVLQTPQVKKTESSPKTDSPQTSQKSKLTEGQIWTKALVADLMSKIFKKAPISQRHDEDLFQAMVGSLTQKAWEEINIPDGHERKIRKNMRRITNGVMESLKKEYGGSKRLTETFIDDRDAFEAAALQHLKIHIEMCLTKRPSLLSRVCKIMWKPFCCCRDV